MRRFWILLGLGMLMALASCGDDPCQGIECGEAAAADFRDVTDQDMQDLARRWAASMPQDRGWLPTADDSSSLTTCFADSQTICRPRFAAIRGLCSPVPFSSTDALKLFAPTSTSRDAITAVAEESAAEAASEIAKDRFCDLLDRSEEEAARRENRRRLGLTDAELADHERSFNQYLEQYRERAGDGPVFSPAQLDAIDRTFDRYQPTRATDVPNTRAVLAALRALA